MDEYICPDQIRSYNIKCRIPPQTKEDRKLFETDLHNLLHVLEKLCYQKADHDDYIRAYNHFIESWAPKITNGE